MNDSAIWNKSNFRRVIENGKMPFPESKPLPYGSEKVPFVIVGDDAFALKMKKPYPQRKRKKNLKEEFTIIDTVVPAVYQKTCLESLQIDGGYSLLRCI